MKARAQRASCILSNIILPLSGQRAFIIVHVDIAFFSATFHAVNVAIIVLLSDIKLEPVKPARVCHLALF